MSKLSKKRAKERFLSNVEIVEKDAILEEIRGVKEEDLYTYFVQKDAFATGDLDEKDINDFILKVYSDWYFLHKNTINKNPQAVRVLSEYEFSPVNLGGDKCTQLVKSEEFNGVLPIYIQYINKLEEKYFLCVKTDELYNREFSGATYEARLYINLPINQLLYFAKEFLDKAYLEEFPAVLKVLNNDYRFDTITIYTDYEYVEKIIELIEEIKFENKSMFMRVGKVNSLLGDVNGYVGFGEQTDSGSAYIASRCQALASLHKYAGEKILKEGVVAPEQKLIFKRDGSQYTASEYLSYLIEKNVIRLVEKKIDELEHNGFEGSEELDRLYAIREDVSSNIDMRSEVDKLKRTFTTDEKYILELDGAGQDSFDYIDKLYRLFTSADVRLLGAHTQREKKAIINKHVFKLTDEFEGVKTRGFLEAYFRAEIAFVLKDYIDQELSSIKRFNNGVITNIKKKTCEKLSAILRNILDDSDEGKEYINEAISDYVRILSTDAFENIEVMIDGKRISIDKDVNEDIVSLLPQLQEDVKKLSVSSQFIDNILREYDINIENICLSKTTKNLSKRKEKLKEETSHYYYDPEGYLSK